MTNTFQVTADTYYQQALEHQRQFRYKMVVECCQQALELSPDFIAALRLQADAFTELQEWESALQCFNRLLEFAPEDYLLWDKQGSVLASLRRQEEAIASIEQAIALTPPDTNDWVTWSNRAHIFWSAGLNDQATECFQRSAEIASQSDSVDVEQESDAWTALGNHYFALAQYEAAIASYERSPLSVGDTEPRLLTALVRSGREDEVLRRYTALIEAEPLNDTAWQRHGLAMTHLGRREDAINSYKRALQLNPDCLCWVALEQLLNESEQPSSLLAVYDEILALHPDHAGLWIGKGALLWRNQNPTEALINYERAVSLDPDNELAWYDRSAILQELGRIDEAIVGLRRAAELIERKNPVHEQELSEFWGYLGDLLFEVERYEEAIEAYSHAPYLNYDNEMNRNDALIALGRESEVIEHYDQEVAENPDNDYDWVNRAIALEDSGHYDAALDSFRQALQINPHSNHAWFCFESALRNLGRQNEIIDDYDKALAHYPDSYGIWGWRGLALYHLERYPETLESFERSLALNSGQSEIWFSHARALRKLQRSEAAVTSCDRALQYDKDINFTLICECQGEAQMDLKQYEAAILCFDRGLEQIHQKGSDFSDHEWRLHFRKGVSLDYLKRSEAAIASYDRAIEQLFEKDRRVARGGTSDCGKNYRGYLIAALYNRATVWYGLEQDEAAIADHTALLKIDPHDWNALYWCSESQMNLSQYTAALEHLNHMIELNPDEAKTYYQKAYCHASLDQLNAAFEALQQAIAIDEQYREMAIAEEVFAALAERL